MANIFIFEPDKVLSQKLCDSLKKENQTPILCDANDPASMQAYVSDAPAVILDARLPWTLCRPLLETFAHHGCPILFLTLDRRMSAHLRALYRGTSDVLCVPFSPKALKAKLQQLSGKENPRLEISLDEDERAAVLDGRRVELTAQEYALLLALMEKPDTPVSREQLLRKAWGYQSMGETRTVDVHIQRLRKKLGVDCIETVYKCGYRLKLI